MTGLSFQYPTWMLVLCILAGAIYAVGLYYKDKRFSGQPGFLPVALGIIRFFLVAILSALLLQPVIKSLETFTRKPIALIIQDDSASISEAMSEEGEKQYLATLQTLATSLKEKYDVKQFSFGASLQESAEYRLEEKVSNISAALQSINDQYANQQVAAVILATDGIYNQGSNPLYQSTQLNAPLYTIALGDTTPQKDLILKNVYYNKIAYLDDQFSVEADIQAVNCAGKKSILTVYEVLSEGKKKILSRDISINSANFFKSEEIILDAANVGVNRYQFVLSAIQDEVSTQNNVREIFLDVLDARQKILLLANAPHPDLTALKQAISSNKNYEVEVAFPGTWKGKIVDFDLVVLHQLPSLNFPLKGLLSTMEKERKPRFFILGSQSDLQAFNNVQNLVSINGDGNSSNMVQASVADNFGLFNISADLKNMMPLFNPLTAPFGDYKEGGTGQVLLYQRIGKIDTKYPLLVVGEEQGSKVAVFTAENSWKWRLFDFLQHDNHHRFDELMSKLVQYLSLQEDKRRFRVSLSDNIIPESEALLFNAELYNESYQLINDPEVSLSIINAEGQEFTFTFSRTEKAYFLDAGYFPTGDYQFIGSVVVNGKNLTYEGRFSVQAIQLEGYTTTADHNLLRLLSEKYGGENYAPVEVDALIETIKKQNDKPIIYQTELSSSVINFKWLFFVLLALLSLEWFLRRYFGSY